MTAPTADQPRDAGPPDLMKMSLDSVAVSQFSITDPDPGHWGPPADLEPIPDGIPHDAGTASCITGLDAIAAMQAREARYQDHQDDVAPQGGSEGDPMPLPTWDHSQPGRNQDG